MIFKGEIPFVRLLIPLILGIIIALNHGHPFIYSWGKFILLIIQIIFLILWLGYKKYSLFRWSWVFGLFIYFYLSILSYTLTVHYSGKFNPQYFSAQKSEFLVLRIVNEPKLDASLLRAETEVQASYIKNDFFKSTGKLMLSIKIDSLVKTDFQYGDLLLVPSKYKVIDDSYNPNEFDYKAYLSNKTIYYQQFIDLVDVRKIGVNQGYSFIYYALLLRKELVDKFIQFLPDKEASALAGALILGYRADLSRDLIEAYSKTGTMHVLSVSGMHVGIVFLVLSFLLKPMNKTRKLVLIRAFIIISVIWFYSLLTGFSPSVCRAALMLSFVVLGKALNKNQNTYNLMAISAFFLLLYHPFYLIDLGFQLSYLAVAGLVYFHPIIYHLFYIKNKFLDYIWSYSALSIAAQLATFPISIYYFHQFPLYFLISNLLVVFPVALIMYAGIAFLIIPSVLISKLLGAFLNTLINWTNAILYHIENLPFSAIEGIWINNFELYLINALIILLVLWTSLKAKSVIWLAFIFCFLISFSFSLKSIQNYDRHELIFYSLRKNTAISYFHQGKSVLISDLDSLDKTFNHSIKPSMSSRGIDKPRFLSLEDQISCENYWLGDNFMQFANFKVIRWKNEFNHLALSNKIDVDVVLISNMKTINFQYLINQVDFKILIFESNIPEYKTKKWLEESKKLNINSLSLNKNPAYIVKL
jgi:competence protein ComEC